MIEAKDYEYLAKIVGYEFVKTDKETLSLWGKDWTKNLDSDPSCVVFPKNSHEISEILKYCQVRNIKVVPNGGRTGLSGGAYAQHKELVLALERLNKILRVDPISRIVEAEAGVATFLLQQEASRHGLFFPIDLASKGSCQIGGNIATNAGGLKFIRFGGTRNHVLGL